MPPGAPILRPRRTYGRRGHLPARRPRVPTGARDPAGAIVKTASRPAATVATVEFDAIILAGGSARRMGGVDKAAVTIGGSQLLERVLGAVGAATRVIVVGPRRPVVNRAVVWTRERPPGGGPVAALEAGLESARSGVVVVLAADLPFADSSLVSRLIDALAAEATAEGVIARDSCGRDQYLAGAFGSDALREQLKGRSAGQQASMRAVVGGMNLARLNEIWAIEDVDTWDDVRAARLRAGR